MIACRFLFKLSLLLFIYRYIKHFFTLKKFPNVDFVIIYRARGPLKWLDPGAFGTLGVGAGFALGAKLCYPDHLILILYGDGSCGYSIVEFDTFVRHKVEFFCYIIILMTNNFLRNFYIG